MTKEGRPCRATCIKRHKHCCAQSCSCSDEIRPNPCLVQAKCHAGLTNDHDYDGHNALLHADRHHIAVAHGGHGLGRPVQSIDVPAQAMSWVQLAFAAWQLASGAWRLLASKDCGCICMLRAIPGRRALHLTTAPHDVRCTLGQPVLLRRHQVPTVHPCEIVKVPPCSSKVEHAGRPMQHHRGGQGEVDHAGLHLAQLGFQLLHTQVQMQGSGCDGHGH